MKEYSKDYNQNSLLVVQVSRWLQKDFLGVPEVRHDIRYLILGLKRWNHSL